MPSNGWQPPGTKARFVTSCEGASVARPGCTPRIAMRGGLRHQPNAEGRQGLADVLSMARPRMGAATCRPSRQASALGLRLAPCPARMGACGEHLDRTRRRDLGRSGALQAIESGDRVSSRSCLSDPAAERLRRDEPRRGLTGGWTGLQHALSQGGEGRFWALCA